MSEEKKTAELRDGQLEQATGGMSTQECGGDIIIPDLTPEIVTGKCGQSFYLENGKCPLKQYAVPINAPCGICPYK